MTRLTPQLLLLSLALSADAFAVSVCRGALRKSALATAGAFGFFQAAMPVLGWYAGSALRGIPERLAPWAAFLILAGVGVRMIGNSLKAKTEKCPQGGATLMALAFATSLDAFAAGVSLSILNTPVLFPALVIGGVTMTVCLLGSRFGVAAGARLGNRLELGAGIVILALGVRALLQG